MNAISEIEKLKNKIADREKDLYFSDGWDQSKQITLDLKKLKIQLEELEKKAIN